MDNQWYWGALIGEGEERGGEGRERGEGRREENIEGEGAFIGEGKGGE